MQALMVCLGVETWAAEWKAQTNPLSYGSTPYNAQFLMNYFCAFGN